MRNNGEPIISPSKRELELACEQWCIAEYDD
jgi:hypothetical protein